MVSKNKQWTSLSVLCVSVVVLLLAGCANLGKWENSPFGRSQRPAGNEAYAKQGAIEKAVAKTKAVAKPSSMAGAVKQMWPFRRKPTTPVEQLAEDDPTRLDYLPEKVGPELYVASAGVSERAGEYEHALKQYGAALQADPSHRNAMIGLARLQHKIGKTDDAIRVYQHALQTHRNDSVILNDLGICYAHQKQTEAAINALSAAVAAAPEREMYANNLAAALVEANRVEEALNHLARHRPSQVANYNVGYLLAYSGRREEATRYLHQALTIDPEMKPARKLLDDLTPLVSALPESSSPPEGHRHPEQTAAPVTVPEMLPVEPPFR